MWNALLQPWILARLALGATALALALVASVGAVRLLLAYRSDAPAEVRTLRLERQSELVGTVLDGAFVLALAGALLTVVAADRLAPSVRGAMCAYGVLHGAPGGSSALLASLVAALSVSAWRGARSVDRGLRRGSLVRLLAGGALAVTAALAADLYLSARFFLGLDFTMVASCCTRIVDAGALTDTGHPAAPWGLFAATLGAGGAALLAHVLLARRPGAASGALASLTGLLAAGLFFASLVRVVAPYVFETPAHQCAYCLLHGEAQPSGLALLSVGALALLEAAQTLPVAWLARRTAARPVALALLSRAGRRGVLVWAFALAAMLLPLLRYRVVAGTFALFS